jgi:hypothetical protein
MITKRGTDWLGDWATKMSNDRCTNVVVVFGQQIQCDRRGKHPGKECRMRMFHGARRMEIKWWDVTPEMERVF